MLLALLLALPQPTCTDGKCTIPQQIQQATIATVAKIQQAPAVFVTKVQTKKRPVVTFLKKLTGK